MASVANLVYMNCPNAPAARRLWAVTSARVSSRSNRVRISLVLLAVCWLALLSPAESQAQVEVPRGFSPLFNGQDFTGWRGVPHFDPRKLAAMPEGERQAKLAEWMKDTLAHWRVANGEIINDGQGPYLTTEKEFGDFE